MERPRWSVHVTKTLFIIVENARWKHTRTQSVPLAADAPQEVRFLAIARQTGTAREATDTPEVFQSKLEAASSGQGGAEGATGRAKPLFCHAIVGCLTWDNAAFLLVVAEAEHAAELLGRRILSVGRVVALPFAAGSEDSPLPAAVANVQHLFEHSFYFSHELDVTRRLQQQHLQKLRLDNLMEAADPRFVWNRSLVDPLLCQDGVTSLWFSPLMQGFVQAREIPSPHGPTAPPTLTLILLARRSSRHAGTRFNARGLDDEGSAANWVETEQVAYLSEQKLWLSYTQVRGSAPVCWEQQSALSPVLITRGSELIACCMDKHLQLVQGEYGGVVFVSLLSEAVSKQATEGRLAAVLHEQLTQRPNVIKMNFDFHARVSGDTFNKDLEELVTDVYRYEKGRCSHFEMKEEANKFEILSRQEAVIRTNCFDCLDRTNIFQCQIAWRWFSQRCSELGVAEVTKPSASNVPPPQRGAGGLLNAALAFADMTLLGDSPLASQTPSLALVRAMWADLGDRLSELYTGAASTMSATLREGGTNARSLLGMGFASVNRVYCAKFSDEAKQDALRLMLGPQKLLRVPPLPEPHKQPCGRLTVAVITWNLCAQPFWTDGTAARRMLQGACGAPGGERQPVDVLALCCQELVELSASNIMLLAEGDSVRSDELDKAMLTALDDMQGERFVKVQSVGMVGLYLTVFIAERLKSTIQGVAIDRLAEGFVGQGGNKGAVAMRFGISETTVCVLSVHLDSGSKEKERAHQLRDIFARAFAGRRGTSGGAAGAAALPAASQHDILVVAGDFNFRLALPEGAELKDTDLIAKEWPDPQADLGRVGEGTVQCSQSLESRKVFEQYDELQGAHSRTRPDLALALQEASLTEGPVLFPPTYKFVQRMQLYDKKRVPAWTDRILHSRVGSVRRRYCALGGLQLSDHRPVCAVLETNLLVVPFEPSKAASSSYTPVVEIPPANTVMLQNGKGSSVDVADYDLLGYQSYCLGSIARVPPGKPVSTPLQPGLVVLAAYNEGWFLASVRHCGAKNGGVAGLAGGCDSVAGATCDVSWLRPRGHDWGNEVAMKWYLCSTGADETLHGNCLDVSTQIRLLGPEAEALVAGAAPRGSAAVAAGGDKGDVRQEPMLDLLS